MTLKGLFHGKLSGNRASVLTIAPRLMVPTFTVAHLVKVYHDL